MPLTMEVREISGITVIGCAGRITFGEEALALRNNVKELIAKNSNLLLDLTAVSYVDSGGIGVLAGLYTSAKSAHGDLKIAGANHRILHVLKITRLVGIIEVFETQDEALRSFAHAAA